MRFRRSFVREVAERINQLGLTACPICGAENSLQASHSPVLLDVGGFHHEKDDPRHDPEANVMFMVRVYCQLCGYVLLFDSEQFRGGDEPVLFIGPPGLEEESDPESG